MALIRKRYASFGREDKTFGIRALIKGDSLAVRVGVFVILSLFFYLIVSLTNHRVNTLEQKQGQLPIDTTSEK
ncbi:MAG: hypothetical protein ABI778_05770 [Ignavibacteriota bacterium]